MTRSDEALAGDAAQGPKDQTKADAAEYAASAPNAQTERIRHPLSAAFGDMPADEFAELVKDIKHNGLLSAIVYTGSSIDGEILDGWHRYRACIAAGVKPRFEPFDFVIEPAVEEAKRTMTQAEYVCAQNAHRRHLTQTQKREIVAALLKAEPEMSNRTIGSMAKVDDKTVGVVRAKLEATAEIPQLTKTTGRDGKARKVKTAKPAPKPRAPTPPGPRGPGSRNVVMVDGVEVLDPGRPLRPNVKPVPKDRPFVVDAVPRVVPEDLMPSLPVDMAHATTPADAEAARILRQIAALDPSGLSDADSFADDLLAASRRFADRTRRAVPADASWQAALARRRRRSVQANPGAGRGAAR